VATRSPRSPAINQALAHDVSAGPQRIALARAGSFRQRLIMVRSLPGNALFDARPEFTSSGTGTIAVMLSRGPTLDRTPGTRRDESGGMSDYPNNSGSAHASVRPIPKEQPLASVEAIKA